ncbi:O-antigen ligase family protein [Gaiella sp.]|uniref:O-antigen ligase family protein n=1 Tax=Gaiella sp. TaxID=2663207 RepID=UPI0039839840
MDGASRSTRSGLAVAILAAVIVFLLWALFAGGAAGTTATARLGSAAIIVAALLLIGWARGVIVLPDLDRAALVAVAAAAALVVWTGLTVWWSIASDRSFDALGKGLVLLAFGIVGLTAAVLPGRPLRAVALILAATLGAALCWALLGKVVPALGPDDAGRVARLRGSIGYWNALALLANAALGLGLWLVATVRDRFGRPAGALLLYVATVVILLTQSRAGVITGLAVLALVLALTTNRIEAALFGMISCGSGLLVAGWALTQSALVEDGVASPDRASSGTMFGVLTLLGAVVVIVAVYKVPVVRLVDTRRRAVMRGLLGGSAVLIVAGLLGLVAAVGNPVTWASDQLSSSGEVVNGPGRFGQLETNSRTVWWGEAWEIFSASPAGGTGASTFEIARKRVRVNAQNVSAPHSVPLQLLSDTGLPGFLLGLTLVIGVALGIRATFRRLEGEERAAASAVVALPVAFGLHALVDIDLDLLAVAGPTMLVSATLLGAGRPPAARVGGLATAGIAAAAAAALWVVVAPALSTREVERAYAKVSDGRSDAAASAARRAQRLNPLSPEPLYARATVATAVRDASAADALYVQVTRLQPENPATWYELGLFRYIKGDLCGAYFALNAAYTLDPKSTLFYRGSELDRARDAVNDTENPACGR